MFMFSCAPVNGSARDAYRIAGSAERQNPSVVYGERGEVASARPIPFEKGVR